MTADQPAAALLSALTTEHFALQTARNATIAETSSRTSQFMAAVTGSVVSLALVSQMSETRPAFAFLALTVLPSVLLVGLLTYARLLETSLEDLAYGLAISRIRAFYLELHPSAERYLWLRPGAAVQVAAADPGMHRNRFHLLGHAATVVAAVDGVLAGTVAGVVTHAAGGSLPSRDRWRSSPPPPCCSPWSATSGGVGELLPTSSRSAGTSHTNSATTAAEQTRRPI